MWGKVFCRRQTLFFSRKCDEELVEQTGGQTYISTYICGIFFLIQVAKDSYSYYVIFVWSCSIALWNIALYFVEWRLCVVVRMSMPSICAAGLSIHTYSVHQYCADQHRSKISPLAASKKFTQRRREWIGAGSLQTAVWMGVLSTTVVMEMPW